MRTQARAHDFNDIKPRKLKIGKLTPTIETDKTIAYSFMNNNNIGGMYTTEKREKKHRLYCSSGVASVADGRKFYNGECPPPTVLLIHPLPFSSVFSVPFFSVPFPKFLAPLPFRLSLSILPSPTRQEAAFLKFVGRCKLPQRGPGRCPRCKRIFV